MFTTRRGLTRSNYLSFQGQQRSLLAVLLWGMASSCSGTPSGDLTDPGGVREGASTKSRTLTTGAEAALEAAGFSVSWNYTQCEQFVSDTAFMQRAVQTLEIYYDEDGQETSDLCQGNEPWNKSPITYTTGAQDALEAAGVQVEENSTRCGLFPGSVTRAIQVIKIAFADDSSQTQAVCETGASALESDSYYYLCHGDGTVDLFEHYGFGAREKLIHSKKCPWRPDCKQARNPDIDGKGFGEAIKSLCAPYRIACYNKDEHPALFNPNDGMIYMLESDEHVGSCPVGSKCKTPKTKPFAEGIIVEEVVEELCTPVAPQVSSSYACVRDNWDDRQTCRRCCFTTYDDFDPTSYQACMAECDADQ